MSFVDTIRQLRERAKLSQQDVAEAIEVARATYVRLEGGDRPPNLDEIKALAEYYQISPADLIDGGESQASDAVETYVFEDIKPSAMSRDLRPEVKPEKLRETLLYVLGRVGAKPNVGETVLYKLLYFIDFDFYEKTGQSITGLTYKKNHFGPTPAVDFRQVVKGMESQKDLEVIETKYFNNMQKKYLPNKRAKLDTFSAAEIKHIDETLEKLSDKSAKELSELSHYDTPWLTAKDGQEIDYRGVFYRTDKTAVTEPEDEL